MFFTNVVKIVTELATARVISPWCAVAAGAGSYGGHRQMERSVNTQCDGENLEYCQNCTYLLSTSMTILLRRCDDIMINYAFYAPRYVYITARECKGKHQSHKK